MKCFVLVWFWIILNGLYIIFILILVWFYFYLNFVKVSVFLMDLKEVVVSNSEGNREVKKVIDCVKFFESNVCVDSINVCVIVNDLCVKI